MAIAESEIILDRVHPTTDLNVTQYAFFNVTVDVGCLNSDCGEVNISLDPVSQPVSCKEILDLGQSTGSKVYTIYPHSNDTNYDVYCDMDVDGGGWTLVGSVYTNTMNDNYVDYHTNLTTLTPTDTAATAQGIWNGMRGISNTTEVHTNSTDDIRFSCKATNTDTIFTVDLAFYDIHWYWELTNSTSDSDVCFEEGNGAGDTQPTPKRTDLIANVTKEENDQYASGYIEGEDSCGDTGDFAIDLDNRGMDVTTTTDWGEDDSVKQCGSTSRAQGAWFVWFREEANYSNAKNGIIPLDPSTTPFFTNVTNPYNQTINQNENLEITWWVNATGSINETYEFFVYANITSDETIGNITSAWNVTIKDLPFIEFEDPTPSNGTTNTQNSIIANISANSYGIKNITMELHNSTDLIASLSDITSFSNTFNSLDDDTYYLNATIEDTSNVEITTETRTITIDTSAVGLDLVFPTQNINVTQNEFFEVTVNVSCKNGNCGQINITLDPLSQPFSCKEILDLGLSTGNGTYEIFPYGNATPTSVHCDMSTNGGGWTLVFGGKGNTATYKSSWAGWDTIGTTVNLSSTEIEGKSPAYDYINTSAIMLETDYSGGSLIMADLNNTYDSLLYLVGPDDPGTNNGNSSWDGGLRGNFSAFGRSGTYFSDDVIKIWQGDGTTDSGDFVTFSTREATDADWNGDTNNIGGEFQTAGPNTADWYYVYVRENISYASVKNGIVPTSTTSTPFYTNKTSNPFNVSLNQDESTEITFWVNATGDLNETFEFFVYANKTSNLAIGNMTNVWNVTIVNATVDYNSPVITLNSPIDNSGNNENLTFNYTVSEINNVTSCELILDGSINQTDNSITKNVLQTFTIDNLNTNSYSWNINCTDDFSNTGTSATNTFSVIKFSDFLGRTTDFTQIDVSNISNLLIETTNSGLINFSENINLSDGTSINQYVNISFNRIEINSENLSALNKSAILYFYNITFDNPRPIKNDEVCPSNICAELSYSSNTYIYNVTGFSVYSVEESVSAISSGGSTSGSSDSSGSGGFRSNLKDDQICTQNSDCNEDYSCYNNVCVKLFDIEILDISNYPVDSTQFNLKYRLKGMADISGDVNIIYWIENKNEKIELGKDVIYVGFFEEKIEEAKIFLPSNVSGDYDLFIQISFENYVVESFRKLHILEGNIISIDNEIINTNLAPFPYKNYTHPIIVGISIIIVIYLIKNFKGNLGSYLNKLRKKEDISDIEEDIRICKDNKEKLIEMHSLMKNQEQLDDYYVHHSGSYEENLNSQIKYYNDYINYLQQKLDKEYYDEFKEENP